jgi:anti-sigma factor RsiW
MTSNDPIYDHLRELSWRRELTAAEEAELRGWLAAHPEAQAEWEAEVGLNAALGRLPQAPVPGNFTARVLQAVERETAAERRRLREHWLTRLHLRWLPKVAFAAVVVGAGLLSYQQVQASYRKKLAESVATVSAVSSLPSPDILKDFDAIRALNPAPAPDEELLTMLQ